MYIDPTVETSFLVDLGPCYARWWPDPLILAILGVADKVLEHVAPTRRYRPLRLRRALRASHDGRAVVMATRAGEECEGPVAQRGIRPGAGTDTSSSTV